MQLKTKNINLTAKAVGISLKTFDSGRNRSLNNDFDSIKMRKNFVQKDKSMGMALKSVPKSESSLDIKIKDRDNEPMSLKLFKSGTKDRPVIEYNMHNGSHVKDWTSVGVGYTYDLLFSEDLYKNMPHVGGMGDFHDTPEERT